MPAGRRRGHSCQQRHVLQRGYFHNCLFAPAELTIGTSGSGTFLAAGVYADNISQSYYTTPFGDNHGIRVYASAPDGEISSTVTAVNQQDYYATVVISGLQTSYEVSAGEMALAYTLTTVDGTALTLNTDYTQDIRDSHDAVPTTFAVKGDYKLTLTAKQDGRCFGSKAIDFIIYSNWPGEGLGTADAPYIVASVSDLNKLMELIETENNPISGQNGAYHFEGKFFRQTADIDYSNVTKDENGCNYYTYGNRRVFCGNYDGYGHTISGIVTKIRSRDALGIFGYVRDGCIKNLTVTSSTFTADQLILEMLTISRAALRVM